MSHHLIEFKSPAARWVILATVLASGMAFLDSTVVNVALPAIADELGADLAGLQWTIDSYLLTLSALLLLGGSLGDLFGRRRVFLLGLYGFTAASALCALAPTIETLIAARSLQGIGAALLVPGSLAIITTNFDSENRGQAIGRWSGLSGVTTAIGPLLGGWLVEAASWRLVFLLNVPIAIVAIVVTLRHVPETKSGTEGSRIDLPGAASATLGLGAVVYALIEGPVKGFTSPPVLLAAGAGLAALVAFVRIEGGRDHPMLPLGIFRSRQFSGANVTTLVVYGALGGALFLVVLQLQRNLGYSPLEAGAALSPITIALLLLSSRAGKLATRIGPRVPMTAGPLIAATGFLLMRNIVPGATYAAAVLPGIAVFGLGMSLTVAPLTTAVLAAVDDRRAGVASGVNNAMARLAGLLAVALLPLAAGIAQLESSGPRGLASGFQRAMLVAAGLCLLGAVSSWLTIRKDVADSRLSSDRSTVRAPEPEARSTTG